MLKKPNHTFRNENNNVKDKKHKHTSNDKLDNTAKKDQWTWKPKETIQNKIQRITKNKWTVCEWAVGQLWIS